MHIPKNVQFACLELSRNGFKAYIVGGCVRDLLLNKRPTDWDITTDALPDEIVKIFPHTYYENNFGTVGIVFDIEDEDGIKEIEVTTFRKEGAYSDNRRPDNITFGKTIEEDLIRRDFTINALAVELTGAGEVKKENIIDLFEGMKDLEREIIRAVGNPHERFNEDALRMMRAIRFVAKLNFSIENETAQAILELATNLKNISQERIRDELIQIILSNNPAMAITLMKHLKLLQYVMPELEEGIGMEQRGVHIYDVWEHLLRSLQHAADKQWPLEIRLAALLHDIAKPATRRYSEESKSYTFLGHEVVGAKMAKRILERLKFPKKTIETVTILVRWHMFFSDTETITLSAVRRLIRNVGQENIDTLMKLRICDRIGTGRPKEEPYRLRKYQSMIEQVMRDPISVGMLKIDGEEIMSILKEKPGRKIGYILNSLMEEVLEDPEKNSESYLKERVLELNKLPEEELKAIAETGKQKQEDFEAEELKKINKKYSVN